VNFSDDRKKSPERAESENTGCSPVNFTDDSKKSPKRAESENTGHSPVNFSDDRKKSPVRAESENTGRSPVNFTDDSKKSPERAQSLIPHISLIVFNSILHQKIQILFFESFLSVMFMLILNIGNHHLNLSRIYRKSAITILPVEIFKRGIFGFYPF